MNFAVSNRYSQLLLYRNSCTYTGLLILISVPSKRLCFVRSGIRIYRIRGFRFFIPDTKISAHLVFLQVLDAPELQDDFYLNLVDWSSQNMLSVGLGSCVYLWSACNSQVRQIVQQPFFIVRGSFLSIRLRISCAVYHTCICYLFATFKGPPPKFITQVVHRNRPPPKKFVKIVYSTKIL